MAAFTIAQQRVLLATSAMHDAGGPLPASQLARLAHCSDRQLTRSFREVLDVTPHDYGQAVRTGRARELLRDRASVIDAVFDASYVSTRGFYEEAGRRLGMPPREFVAGASGHVLTWSVADVRIGDHPRHVIAVASDNGLCAVRLGSDADELLAEVVADFPKAELVRDDDQFADVMAALAALARGQAPQHELPVDVQGTAFQAKVWQAIVDIPPGQTRSYAEIADAIGSPAAVRAVGRACATNSVALVVPCHRVVKSDGSLSGYRWGIELKAALLRAEGRDIAEQTTMVV